MSEDVWISLGHAMAKKVNDEFGTSLKIDQPFVDVATLDRARVLSRIRRQIRDGCPVLVGLAGALDHYTVLAGHTDSRIILFDSSGLRWVTTSRIGLNEDPEALHRIWPSGILFLAEDW